MNCTVRRLLYKSVVLLFGVLFCLGVFASIVCVAFADKGIVYPVASIALTVAFLVAAVVARRSKHRWMRQVAVYADYRCLAEYIGENRSTIIRVGSLLFGGPVHGVQYGDDDLTIQEGYELLSRHRESGAISEEDYRAGVDRLIEFATRK